MGCVDDAAEESILPGPEIPPLNKTPYIIHNDEGITTKFAVIGDVHSNVNILQGALEEIERRGHQRCFIDWRSSGFIYDS